MTVPAVVHEKAFAKVNLFLEVLGKRSDGFHELETVMHEVELFDDLELEPGGEGVRLEVSDASVGLGEDNLAVKAVRALERRLGRSLPCRIRLTKRIPAGGGLGGGSSDSGAVLRALNRGFALGLEAKALEEAAATFGSDTSFFVRGGTAICRGRGEIVEATPCPVALWFLLILPGIHAATPVVFRSLKLTPQKKRVYDLARCLESGDVEGIRQFAFNRLEEPARREYPSLDRLLSELRPHRPVMSGSGSTIFVLCDDEAHAQRLNAGLAASLGTTTVVARTARR